MHGAYSRCLGAVENGPFAENPEEVEDFLRALVLCLAPRGALEAVRAEAVARIQLREQRLERYERALLETRDMGSDSRTEAAADHLQDWLVEHVACWNEGRSPDQGETSVRGRLDERPWELMAIWLRGAFAPRLKVGGLWDDEREPTSAADWRRAFEAVAKHRFPTAGGLRESLREANAAQAQRAYEREDRMRRTAAERSLAVLHTTQAERTRLTSELTSNCCSTDCCRHGRCQLPSSHFRETNPRPGTPSRTRTLSCDASDQDRIAALLAANGLSDQPES